MTEELAFHQGFGNTAAVDRNKGLVGPVAEFVDRLGDQLFAGAALAGNQDIGAGFGHLAHHLVDVLHARAVAYDLAEMLDLLSFILAHPVVGGRMAAVQSLGDGVFQLLIVKGLGHIVVGPFVHGLHGGFGGGKGRYHDHHGGGIAFFGGPEHIQAVEIAQADIA